MQIYKIYEGFSLTWCFPEVHKGQHPKLLYALQWEHGSLLTPVLVTVQLLRGDTVTKATCVKEKTSKSQITHPSDTPLPTRPYLQVLPKQSVI